MKTARDYPNGKQLPFEVDFMGANPPSGILKRITVNNIVDAAAARTTTRKLAKKLDYDLVDQIRIAAIIFELANTLIICAGCGELLLLWYVDGEDRGVKCCCCLVPPKILLGGTKKPTPPDFSKVKKLADEFEYLADPQQGDSVVVTVWRKPDFPPHP